MTGRKTKTSELLNTTLPTLLDTGSLIDVEEEDVAANTLGECLFEPCNTVSSPSLDGSDMPESSQLPKVKRALSSPTGYDIEVVQKDDEFEKKLPDLMNQNLPASPCHEKLATICTW